MNPVTTDTIGSVTRFILGLAGGWLVSKGLTGDQIQLVAGVISGVLAIGWSLYQKHEARTEKHDVVAATAAAVVAQPAMAHVIVAEVKEGATATEVTAAAAAGAF